VVGIVADAITLVQAGSGEQLRESKLRDLSDKGAECPVSHALEIRPSRGATALR